MGILNKYKQTLLENRVKRLEQAVNEKSVGRGHQDRIHFTIWKFLRDNGPKTKEEIQAQVGSSIRVLPEMERENCIFKNGDLYSFNPDYAWDDIGVVPPAPEQIRALLAQNGSDPESDAEDNQPVEPSQAPRQRQPRQRAVKANIFSKKYDEVKAAIDQGQDVNQEDSNGRSAVGRACMSDGPDAARIVQLLLDNGANPNSKSKGGEQCLFVAISSGNRDMIRALIRAGASTAIRSRKNKTLPLLYVIDNGIFDGDILLSLVDKKFTALFDRTHQLTNYLSQLFRDNRIDRSTYEEILNRIYNYRKEQNSNIHYIFSDKYIDDDIHSGSTTMLDLCVKDNWLPVGYFFPDDNKVLKTILDAAKKIDYSDYDGDLSNALKFIYHASEVLGESPDWIWDSFDVNSIVKNSDRYNILKQAIFNSIKYNNKDLLNKIAKGVDANTLKKFVNTNELIGVVTNNEYNPSRDTAIAACRILNKLIKYGDSLSVWALRDIGRSKNRYLVDYFIDKGFGDELYTLPPDYRSDVTNDALKENEYSLNDSSKVRARLNAKSNEREYTRRISSLVADINDDDFMPVDRAINAHPEYLEDQSVIDAINDPKNDHNVTARQLRRRLAQHSSSKPKELYDL